MARFFDEQYEETVDGGDGYDETWSQGETVGAGCTVDQDAATSDVSSPSGWGSECLKLISGGNICYTQHNDDAAIDPVYFRAEFVITASSMGNGQFARIMQAWDSANESALLLFIVYRTSDNKHHVYARIGSGVVLSADSAALELNTRYRVEVKIDTVNGWELRLDGVTVDSGPNTESNKKLERWRWGYTSASQAFTYYSDLFTLDDADWVGAEAAGGLSIPIAMYHYMNH